jgi:hypothetical protein
MVRGDSVSSWGSIHQGVSSLTLGQQKDNKTWYKVTASDAGAASHERVSCRGPVGANLRFDSLSGQPVAVNYN